MVDVDGAVVELAFAELVDPHAESAPMSVSPRISAPAFAVRDFGAERVCAIALRPPFHAFLGLLFVRREYVALSRLWRNMMCPLGSYVIPRLRCCCLDTAASVCRRV